MLISWLTRNIWWRKKMPVNSWLVMWPSKSFPIFTYFTAFIALFSEKHKEPEPVSSFFYPWKWLTFPSARLWVCVNLFQSRVEFGVTGWWLLWLVLSAPWILNSILKTEIVSVFRAELGLSGFFSRQQLLLFQLRAGSENDTLASCLLLSVFSQVRQEEVWLGSILCHSG